MRIAVISDIHGNLEAFQAVLADINTRRIDAIFSLGDNIGYGPDPETVTALVREKEIPSVMGNHELGVSDEKYLDWFNILARKALLNTKGKLSEESVAYCGSLPRFIVFESIRFVHGIPPDDPLTYIIELTDFQLLNLLFKQCGERICFVGHTHMLEIISLKDDRLTRTVPRGNEAVPLDPAAKYIVNAGSVGQPRDRINNNAKYIIYDAGSDSLEVRFVSYDAQKTADKIIALGWPETLAHRLL